MNIFGNRNNGNEAEDKEKLRDFLRNQHIEDAEILSEESFDKKEKFQAFGNISSLWGGKGIFVASLVAGLLAGFIYGHFFAPLGVNPFTSFDAASLTKNVQLAKAERIKYVSKILHSDVDVYNMPSDVSGNVIAKLNRDMKVEYLELVPSLDTKENVGVTRFDIKISRLFSKSFVIPEGTEVNLVGYNSSTGEYNANVSINGKIHNVTLNSQEVKLPYTRGWVKIRTENGQEGYVYGDAVSVRELK